MQMEHGKPPENCADSSSRPSRRWLYPCTGRRSGRRHLCRRSLESVDGGDVSNGLRKLDGATGAILPAELAARWQQHLSDYKVMPLFPLFGRGVYRLPAEQQQAQELKDFEGYVLPNFTLRTRAQKLDYARANHGESWFTDYTKTWRGLGITATIEFSGSSFPEENKPVALLCQKFLRADGDYQESLTLGEAPGLLLSECYQDLRQLAAEGKGFDAQWVKTCGV